MKGNISWLIIGIVLGLAGLSLWNHREALVPPEAQPTPVLLETPPPPPAEIPQLPLPPAPVDALDGLRSVLALAKKEDGLTGAALGFCLIDPAGQIALDDGALTALIPASTLKTVTTASAVELLGPNYQIATHVLATQAIKDGVIIGDLIIQGGGDPLLSLADLEGWVQQLKTQGLTSITGRIIGDGRLFTGSIYDDFWNWGDIGNGYGSPVSGLNLEHNRYTASFEPGSSVGQAAKLLQLTPEVPGVSLINEILTADPNSATEIILHGGEQTASLFARGTIKLGQPESVLGAVPDPARFAASHLRTLLIAAGITVKGPSVSAGSLAAADVPSAPHVLLTHQSPALVQLITSIHATSDNHETECLFRLLGLKYGQTPDEVIRQHWKGRGLDFVALRMEDGCGLARADHIRPVDLARLQYLVGQGPQGPTYKASLLSDGPVRWKGGAMSSIRSSCGYVTGKSGREWSFALMLNHYTSSDSARRLRAAVIEQMSQL